MAYYNGNHRMVQRQPMMTCPNQAQNRQSSSGYVEIQLQHSHAVIKMPIRHIRICLMLLKKSV